MQFEEKIKDLIKNGEIEKSLEILYEYVIEEHRKFEKDVILLTSKSTELAKKYRNNLISNTDYIIEKSRITNSLLELLEIIESNTETSKNVIEKKVFKIYSKAVIPIFFVIIIGVIANYFYNKRIEDEPLTVEEITGLANGYGLNDWPGINSHLSFNTGDYGYWKRKNLAKGDIELQFEARKRILEIADSEKRKIETQGDLANEAELLIIRDLAKKYNLLKPRNINPHLALDQGDFSYWKDQGYSFNEIEKRFEIMNKIISKAEMEKTEIKTKGDLGYLVEEEYKQK